MDDIILVAVLGAMGVERAAELALNRRNARWLRARGARFDRDDGFGLILASQLVLFGGTAAEAALAPWSGVGAWTWVGVGLLALAQAVRYWAIATLGRRWCIRVATLPSEPRIAGGPYRFVPHPNYSAVALEAIALPLAFHAWATLLVAGALTAVALVRRIRREERALRANEPRRPAAEGRA